ncbi:MAG: hypothetical protein ACRCZY_07160 [Phocaeicola sp.]
MNEKINLAELLKGCEGETIYSMIHGDVTIDCMLTDDQYKIQVKTSHDIEWFSGFGELLNGRGECVLFPSKDQRDWKKWKAEREAKMEHQFKPFEKVLVRDGDMDLWTCNLFSCIMDYTTHKFCCINVVWKQCIPYEGNEHLLGTTDNV